mgnify:CR=1 FL=1
MNLHPSSMTGWLLKLNSMSSLSRAKKLIIATPMGSSFAVEYVEVSASEMVKAEMRLGFMVFSDAGGACTGMYHVLYRECVRIEHTVWWVFEAGSGGYGRLMGRVY